MSRDYKTNRICPACKHTQMERIPRSMLVKLLLGWLPIKRYICYKCKRRYHIIEKIKNRQSARYNVISK